MVFMIRGAEAILVHLFWRWLGVSMISDSLSNYVWMLMVGKGL